MCIRDSHGATDQVFSTESPEAKALARRALAFDLHLLQARCKHLGTENNLRILTNIYEGLRDKLEFSFNTEVAAIARAEGGYRLTLAKGGEVACKYLIAAPGRSGAEWFSNQCKDLGLELLNNQVDIGVRVELPATVFEHITDVVYESKLVYRTKQYGLLGGLLLQLKRKLQLLFLLRLCSSRLQRRLQMCIRDSRKKVMLRLRVMY